MFFRIIADITLMVHFLFIVYVLLGALLVLKWRKTIFIHLPVVLWGVLIEYIGWICPLTPLENYFRMKAAGVTYSGGFIAQYLFNLIYMPGLTKEIQILLGSIVLIVNVFIYSVVYRKTKKIRKNLE